MRCPLVPRRCSQHCGQRCVVGEHCDLLERLDRHWHEAVGRRELEKHSKWRRRPARRSSVAGDLCATCDDARLEQRRCVHRLDGANGDLGHCKRRSPACCPAPGRRRCSAGQKSQSVIRAPASWCLVLPNRDGRQRGRAVHLLVIGGGVGLRPDVDVRGSTPRPLRSNFEGIWGLVGSAMATRRIRARPRTRSSAAADDPQ